ncbi:type II secretion system protein N [Parahaliea aestuarii]|uniref:Type II secretion system protein N n=1 Tax=Parahaliea aestuarii TaxID=1852021 RepID=A0A5C9A2A8_9GAMM|nr:type II secretion system protein N [Parahaliea aestuarii]TXS94995.1 type II secretion system protein N [Parahaliea aestuarii]
MARFAALAALLLLLLVFLIVGAPARLLPAVLPAGQVQLDGLSGTLWRGSASRCLLQTAAGPLQLGRVEWQLRPLSLLTLAPALDFDSQWGGQHASGRVKIHGVNDIGLSQLSARADASLLRQLAPLAVDGGFSLQADYLRIRDARPAGARGRLVWEHGAWTAPQGRIALGSYALDFNQPDADTALAAEVITLAGPVQAVGDASLAGQDYRVDIRIRAEQGALDPALQQGLSLMARPDGNGYHLTLTGAL